MTNERPAIQTIDSRVVYRNQWLSMREDQIERLDGSRGIYSVIDRPDFAVVIPAENDGFHLVEQYRYPIQRRAWEFPQGAFPPGMSGTPTELARRELAEETGLTADRLENLGFLHSAAGMSGQGFHVFLATGLHPGAPNREQEEQDMRQAWFSRKDFEKLIQTGQLTDDSTLAAYLLWTMHTRT